MTGELSNLKAPRGANRPRKHKGRGAATDGKTSGRGMKGQGARGSVPPGFEGGQTPLSLRLPKLNGVVSRRLQSGEAKT